MKRDKIDLNGTWELYYSPEKGGKWNTLSEAEYEKWDRVPASVPGNVQLDLVNAGLEEDPYYDENYHNFRKYEYYQWIYKKNVEIPREFAADGSGQIILRFGAIDTYADIYVNGMLAGTSDNMLIEQEFDITGLCAAGENTVLVHIHSAMNHARGQDYAMFLRGTSHRAEICFERRAPHTTGWDIAARLVTAGLWRNVEIERRSRTRITETYFAASGLDRDGIILHIGYRFVTDHDDLDDFFIRFHGQCQDSVFEVTYPAVFVSDNQELRIPNPRLWWPKGMGDHPLYEVTTSLIWRGETVDEKKERIGLRSFKLERDFAPNQKFQFYVNNKKYFVMGTNWVPLDLLHSRDASRLERAHALLVDSGCNMVRCWGGNVYEDTRFFDLCDENGIMVWQDCAMGNCNYSQDRSFTDRLETEIASFAKKVRNHPSLAIWSGDNEVDQKNMGFDLPHADSRKHRIAHEVLPKVLQMHDPYRYLLPTSPEIPFGFTMENVPEQHTWGPRAYYKDDYYKNSTASFIGEAGYHGCPAPETLRAFLPEDKLWPFDGVSAWASHSTVDVRMDGIDNGRNELMRDQVEMFYGEVPQDLETFSVLSQIVQAEAMKFFVERTRTMKPQRTGIIWWNLIDGWPQISDAVTDYYYRTKLAYHYLKCAQRPFSLMLKEQNGWEKELVGDNVTDHAIDFSYKVTNLDRDMVVALGRSHLDSGETAVITKFKAMVSEQALYIIEWTVGEETYHNHYLGGFPAFNKEEMLKKLEIIRNLDEKF